MTIGTQYLTRGAQVEPRTALAWTTLVAGALVLLYWALYFSDDRSAAIWNEARLPGVGEPSRL